MRMMEFQSEITERQYWNELEVRINLTENEFNYFSNNFKILANVPFKKNSVKYYKDSSIRSIDGIYERKTEIKSETKSVTAGKTTNFKYKIVYSYEEDDETLKLTEEEKKSLELSYTKERSRKSAKMTGDIVTIDLSKFNTPDGVTTRYNLELEVGSPEHEEILFQKLDEIIRLKTLIPTRNYIVREYNKILGVGGGGTGINFKDSVVKARNLKKKDFPAFKSKDYTITVKLDGFLSVLIFKDNVLCLISADKDEILTKGVQFYRKGITAFVGEYIKESNYFVPFDCLIYEGENISKIPSHIERLTKSRYSKEYVHTTAKGINLGMKTFFPVGRTPETFAVAYKHCKDEAKKIQKEGISGSDGFVVTPIYSSHIPESSPSSSGKKSERILTKNDDVCKLKFFDDLTIDLLVKDGKLADQKVADLLSSKGISVKPVNPAPRGDSTIVVEFRPEIKEDGGKIYLVKNRIRSDKQYPNSINVVNDVASDIVDPITEDFILLKNLDRLFLHNNIIKKKLIDGLGIDSNTVIIDIGSGRGGDIPKYKKYPYKHIIFVEPDPINLKEFKKRAALYDLQNYTLLEVGYQSTEKIKKEVDKWVGSKFVLTCFLSMTFMWGSSFNIEKFKDLLMCTIPGSYKLCFFTAIGERMRNAKSSGPIKIKHDGNSLRISIDDSIVRGQTEFYVDLGDISQIIGSKQSILQESVNKETDYLSETEYEYGKNFVTYSQTVKVKPEECSTSSYSRYFDDLSFTKPIKYEVGEFEKIKIRRDKVYIETQTVYHAICLALFEDFRNMYEHERTEYVKILRKYKPYKELCKMLGVSIRIDGEFVYDDPKNKYIIKIEDEGRRLRCEIVKEEPLQVQTVFKV